ncbi:MAG: SPOR domain-containing protein [Ignavibacteriaceae bacterium]
MISKDELVKIVAETCGISLENSSVFFDVFVNRVSNKLKPGEILNFNNYGYFQKRQCRINLEKTSTSSEAKSYLIHLVIFSLEPKVKNDLARVHFLKIPNLKTLWLDDEDFLRSLKAGDFAPYTERNQLIKAFATKAEVILSNQRKDYDSESENELVIPLSFDLNFLIRTGHKSTSSERRDVVPEFSKEETPELKDKKTEKKNKKDSKKKVLPEELDRSDRQVREKFSDNSDVPSISSETEAAIREKLLGSTDFEPVRPKLSSENEEATAKDYDTVKFNFENRPLVKSEEESNKKFTEVKSKTETYHLRDDLKKGKKKKEDKYKEYRERKSFVPLIIGVALIIISVAAVYFYFFRDNSSTSGTKALLFEVKPPSNTNVVERDYEFAVSYPYPQNETQIKIEGYDSKLFYSDHQNTSPVVNTEQKDKIENKIETAKEKIENKETTQKENIEQKEVTQKEEPVIETKQEKTTEPESNEKEKLTEQSSSRIFLYKGFYVVYVGSYSSLNAANREAEKYSNLGYNPVIETIETRGRRTQREYKLNVGDFTSVDFAKQFESKYLNK